MKPRWFDERFEVLVQLWRMILRRKAWALLPVVLFLALILVFLAVSEMPALIPFFYAVF